jgi:hypothetical protein
MLPAERIVVIRGLDRMIDTALGDAIEYQVADFSVALKYKLLNEMACFDAAGEVVSDFLRSEPSASERAMKAALKVAVTLRNVAEDRLVDVVEECLAFEDIHLDEMRVFLERHSGKPHR